ncbi:MAG: ABC transporter ATP-binding protein/permease [Gammaproteobacteria bacterium]|nr:MAG: ABC transporter ATP-binding protein/permease [Gammaproteobacteria bacterium]
MARSGDLSNQLLQSHPYTTWQLIKLYWQSEERFSAYVFFFVTIVMTVVLVMFDVAFSYWANDFYTALQAYDKHGVLVLLGLFCLLAFFYIVFAVYRYYISQLFGLRWRRWLTHQFINRWLANRSYYYLENFDEHTDNPDQRIQEDIGALVTSSISLSIGLIGSITTIFGFVYVLWQLSGQLHLNLGSLGTILIPGYLVWIAIIYAALGTYFTFKIGYPLVSLNFEQQRREATFRFAAIDLREHAESVALYEGEHHQKGILSRLFGNVLDNWLAIILRQKLLLWFTAGYNQISVILPLVVALPNYFEKIFLLGGVMQSMRAFTSIHDALSFLVNSYPDIAQWRAVTRRLTSFIDHMAEQDKNVLEGNKLRFRQDESNKIIAKNISISTPQGKKLLQNINEELVYGQDYLIKGFSGIGKSTFVRALAGIWPFSAGEVTFPGKQKVMYLPQKPYMPIGTLAEAIIFPDKLHPEFETQLEEVLRECHLENLIPRLQETASWSEQLSPGEQQRVAFARVLLHQPDWVFLDETTSMLDLANEEHLYRLLKSKLPHCSIISVGHRPSLDAYHGHVINMMDYQYQPSSN